MSTPTADPAPPAKCRKVHDQPPPCLGAATERLANKSLERSISPPHSTRKAHATAVLSTPSWNFDSIPQATTAVDVLPSKTLSSYPSNPSELEQPGASQDGEMRTSFASSPIQLTCIEGLRSFQNVDTVGLKEILGDPLIRECWNFNFLFDLDFVMQHFDRDVRDMVKVKIVHGFWRRDDERRIRLLEDAERYPNIELLSAYIPDPFGTHHSKMLILFRHDDTAQVIIHTANMIYRDWCNMTQAVWSSPLLPLSSQKLPTNSNNIGMHPIGSGKRFQADLTQYLAAYERRTKGLISQLTAYDFSAIKAAFIGSVPSRQKPSASAVSRKTAFGWLGLQQILSQVPLSSHRGSHTSSHIVTQISSIATLGAQPTWLTHFQSVLARNSGDSKTSTDPPLGSQKVLPIFPEGESRQTTPKFSVIFPTPEEIRTSLDGYNSGGSIHWKLQSAQQQKQLEYMHPLLCHWKSSPCSSPETHRKNAHRDPAAPHIKTYIRFSDKTHRTIDWVMVTSANLSKQAWGDVVNKKEEIWIQSWEAGVVVWPALFKDLTEGKGQAHVAMVPVFGKDMPGPEDVSGISSVESGDTAQGARMPSTVVGFRMPYSLPLHPYGPDEKPWCATMAYGELDWKGQAWVG